MALPSPITEATDLVNCIVLVQGSQINGTYQVLSVTVAKELNRIPLAKLLILDGDPSSENFSISSSADFVPGNTIEIKAGYESSSATIFSGIIIKHGVKLHHGVAPILSIECRDKAVKMTIGRKNMYFQNTTDSDAIQTVIGNYSLTADVSSTGASQKEIVQFYSTDWDFILSRADINGFVVNTDAGKITVGKIDTSPTPVLGIVYGDSMLKFDVEMDTRSQLSSVQSSSWDYTTQAIIQSASQDPGLTVPGNISSSTLASVTAPSQFLQQTTAPVEQANLQNWSNAKMTKSAISKIRGSITFQGSSLVNPGVMLGIDGLGDRFDGNAYVSGVRHVIEEGNWLSEVVIGMSSEWFSEIQEHIEAPPTAGLLPGIQGLQIGVVTKIDADPDGQFRVQVKIPIIDSSQGELWARLGNFYGTNNAGSYFYPEIDDEVILGFLNNDPRYPIILGSLYSSQRPAPYTPDDKNTYKAIVTNSQLKVIFDDVKKITTISTPGNNVIELSDEGKSISITDQNSNSIKLGSDGITINSASDIKITASGKITTSSNSNTSISASGGDVTISGLNFSASGQVSAKVNGSASAQFTADGEVTVKGAMVMIN